MSGPEELLLPIARTESQVEAERWQLLFAALAVPYRLVRDEAGWELSVWPVDAERARAFLKEDAEEGRRGERLRESDRDIPQIAWSWYGALVWTVVLVSTFQLRPELAPKAALVGEAVRGGEVWRVITALMQHADTTHLIVNVFMGGAVIAAVCGHLGEGLGLLTVLVAGALGNVASVGLHGPGYVAVGASTAIFGGVGVLSAALARRRQRLGIRWVVMPLIVGCMMLIEFGLGGGSTDVVAHVTGFASGVGVGLLAGLPARTPVPAAHAGHSPELGVVWTQAMASALALVLVILAWSLALRR